MPARLSTDRIPPFVACIVPEFVRLAGATVHFVDEGVDTGPIVLQAAVPVLDGDTEATLSARILDEEHRLYPQAIRLYAEGRLEIAGRRVSIRARP